MDLAAVAVALAYGGLAVSVGDPTHGTARIAWPVDVLVGVVAAVALWWRRRHPAALAAALVPLGAVSVTATGAVLVAVFTVAVRCRPRAAIALAGAHAAMGPVYFLLQPDPGYPLWVDLVVRSGITAGVVGWGLYARARHQLMLSLHERAVRAEADQAARVEQARHAERERIAREMHDVLAHRLSLVSLHAGALEVQSHATPEQVEGVAAVIRTSVHEALQELREVIGVLRAGTSAEPDRPQPGLADVPDLVESVRDAGTAVRYTCRLAAGPPPGTLGRTAYRLVQEGLTNARKHAPRLPVRILLDGGPGTGLRVEVENAIPVRGGPTGPPVTVPGAGAGLIGLQERVELAGGRLRHGPGPDGATFRLHAWLPW